METHKNYWTDCHGTFWKDVVGIRNEHVSCWCWSGSDGWSSSFSPTSIVRCVFFYIFVVFTEKNLWILSKKFWTGVYECVQLGADPHWSLYLVNVNVFLGTVGPWQRYGLWVPFWFRHETHMVIYLHMQLPRSSDTKTPINAEYWKCQQQSRVASQCWPSGD